MELGIFTHLQEKPGRTSQQLAQALSLNLRGVTALADVLVAHGLLVRNGGALHLSLDAREYLLPDSRFYWGPMLLQDRCGRLCRRRPDAAAVVAATGLTLHAVAIRCTVCCVRPCRRARSWALCGSGRAARCRVRVRRFASPPAPAH